MLAPAAHCCHLPWRTAWPPAFLAAATHRQQQHRLRAPAAAIPSPTAALAMSTNREGCQAAPATTHASSPSSHPPAAAATTTNTLSNTSSSSSSKGSRGVVYPLDLTLTATQVPPAEVPLGPRVEHLTLQQDGPLAASIAAALDLPQPFILSLIHFGAVYYCPVMPKPNDRTLPVLSQQQLSDMDQLRAAAIARHGKDPRLQIPARVLLDVPGATAGGYVRVHVHPKRFPAVYGVDWGRRLLLVSKDLVVVDKPAGVQVPATVDNIRESVVACAGAALGLPPDALLPTHRLDVGTSGVVVLARATPAAHTFQQLLQDKADKVVKVYRCLTAAPPPLGPAVHWALVGCRAPGEPAHTRVVTGPEVPRAVRCELRVLQVDQVPLTGAAAAQWGPQGYEATLQLVTGRTHQIRAQMAAMGCPLLGDHMYAALAAQWQQEQGQQQVQEQQEQQQPHAGRTVSTQQPAQQQPQGQQEQGPQQQQQQQQVKRGSDQAQPPVSGWAAAMQADPLNPIGLQAYQLQLLQWEGLELDPLHTDQQQDPCSSRSSSSSRKDGEGTIAAPVDTPDGVGSCTAGGTTSEPGPGDGGLRMPPTRFTSGGLVQLGGGGGEVGAQGVQGLVEGQGEVVVFTAGTPWWRQ